MAELTTEQIVKIVIAVLILVLVLSGVYLAFKGSIFPYFSNIAPAHQPDLENPYYKELLKNDNLVATFSYYDDEAVISVRSGVEYVKTPFYITKKSGKLYRTLGARLTLNPLGWFGKDQYVGIVNRENGVIMIESEFKEESYLSEIDGGYKYEGGIYSSK